MVLLVQDGDNLEVILQEVVLQQEEEDGAHQQEDRVHHLQEEDGVHQGIKLKVLVQVLKLGVALLTTKSLLLQEKKMEMDDLEVGDHKLHRHLIILRQVGVNLLHHQEKQQQEQVLLNLGDNLITVVVIILIIQVDG